MNIFRHRILLFFIFLLMGILPMAAQESDNVERRLADIVEIYFEGSNDYEFYRAIENYRNYTKANNHKMKYYRSWYKEIMYDINHNHYYEALEKTEQLRNILQSEEDEKYYYMIDYLMGVFYGTRDNNELSQEHLRSAFEKIKDDDLAHERINILNTLTNINIFDDMAKGYEYADSAIVISQDSTDLCTTYALKSMVALANDDRVMFESCYNQIRKLRKGKSGDYQYGRYVRMGRFAFDGKFDKAQEICDSITFEVGRMYFKSTLYHMSGDMQNENESLRKLINAIIHRNNKISTITMSNIKNEFDADITRSHMHKIQLILTGIIVFLVTAGFIGAGYLYRKRKKKKVHSRHG